MKFTHFILGLGVSVFTTWNAQSMTLKANNFAAVVKSKNSLEEVCKINQGTKVSLLTQNIEDNFASILIESGSCAGRKGFMSVEFLSMEEKQGPSLSRSTPILKDVNDLKYDCFALQNTSIQILSEEKNALVSKIRVLDGLCKGMVGWVSRESIKI